MFSLCLVSKKYEGKYEREKIEKKIKRNEKIKENKNIYIYI